MSPHDLHRRPESRDSAFSLVEIVIALGIVAFALVALLGLLPTGLKNFTGTMNTAVGSQIAQRIFNDLQIADWGNIGSTNRYFDEQGNELTSNQRTQVSCIYWVNVSTNAPAVVVSTTNLLSVTVFVANNPGGWQTNTTLLFNSTNANTMTFTALIGRSR